MAVKQNCVLVNKLVSFHQSALLRGHASASVSAMPCLPATNVAMSGTSAVDIFLGLRPLAANVRLHPYVLDLAERRRTPSVRGSDGSARCSSQARSTRVVKAVCRE